MTTPQPGAPFTPSDQPPTNPIPAAIVPGSYQSPINPPPGQSVPQTPGQITKFEVDLPLAALLNLGAVSRSTFPLGTLPANARVFPQSAEIEVDQPLGTGAAFASFNAAVIGGNTPQGVGITLAAIGNRTAVGGGPGIYGGSNNASGEVNALCSTQGNQTISATLDISGAGALFNQLTTGHLKVRILYTIVP